MPNSFRIFPPRVVRLESKVSRRIWPTLTQGWRPVRAHRPVLAVTFPVESDGLVSQDNRVASVRCDGGLLASPAAVPPATQTQDELYPITLVRDCTLVRQELFGVVLPPFANNLKISPLKRYRPSPPMV